MKRTLLLLSLPTTFGFVVQQQGGMAHQQQQHASRTQCLKSTSSSSHHQDHLDELDAMKRLLDDELHYNDNDETLLTFGARQRKELELQLLQRLEHSDSVVDTLMNVWIHEAPSAIREIDVIEVFEEYCESLESAEVSLRSIVGNHPQWAEPMNRLALVIAMNGDRDEEATSLIETVLKLKPWHFEAQHMKVLLALRNSGMGVAVTAARNTLPPLSQPKRRRKWVQRAVMQAKASLREELERSEQSKHPVLLESAGGSSSWQ